ncbi:MAG: hypothetical protein IPO93_18405 [Actinobacteria bacterium]|nr:hypothetical protein [Actinomycetota bacterium]
MEEFRNAVEKARIVGCQFTDLPGDVARRAVEALMSMPEPLTAQVRVLRHE